MNQDIPSSLRRRLQAMVISMIKGIVLSGFKDTLARESFIAGAKRRTFPLYGLCIDWGLTESSIKSRSALAESLARVSTNNSVDPETCVDIIRCVTQEICLDQNFFRPGIGFGRKSNTLFDQVAGPIDQFCDKFIDVLRGRIAEEAQDRLTLVPIMPRLISPSFFVDSENVGLINRNETSLWKKISAPKFDCTDWSIATGSYDQDRQFFGPSKFLCYGLSIDHGSHTVCSNQAYFKLQMLTTVALACHASAKQAYFHTVMADPPDGYIQFNSVSSGYTASGRSPLLPYFASEISLDADSIEEIKIWYGKVFLLPTNLSGRTRIAAHFANLGLNSKALNSFVFFYVSLDALFGIRHKVEESIKAGIAQFLSHYSAKANWLFELRNEIIHGGCRSISEWKRFDKYRRHFDSDPLDDIRNIALQCIWRYPQETTQTKI